ncbi:MAG: geranylgeranylglyceryl/heptaprenylglyceryl phosphate synthase [Bacteroidetes Order II. Incertae sedis bacterium]|nr:geranylgeranylglyceryl/heptaprenylglyceryl phosphate synthase [Bacteroidetes Order II. bacterium]
MNTSIYHTLLEIAAAKGAGFIVLIDPDALSPENMSQFLGDCEAAGTDAFFLGGSLMHVPWMDRYVQMLKQHTTLPIIGFPGSLTQISGHLDAMLYLSVISGRNPDYLFGQHVYAAPILRKLGLEAISTGYMLIESGALTSAQYMSNSMPMPRKKNNIAVATALAAEMMGMKLLMTDAGSGADFPVPVEMVAGITAAVSIPLMVGGGLRTPEMAAARAQAGASFIVVGNAFEDRPDKSFIAEMATATHAGGQKRRFAAP